MRPSCCLAGARDLKSDNEAILWSCNRPVKEVIKIEYKK